MQSNDMYICVYIYNIITYTKMYVYIHRDEQTIDGNTHTYSAYIHIHIYLYISKNTYMTLKYKYMYTRKHKYVCYPFVEVFV